MAADVAKGHQRPLIPPYNPSAGAKYEWLGLPYEVQGEPQSEEELVRLVGVAQAEGVQATVG